MTMVFISGRQLGKTEQIIRWWLVDPEHSVILTSSVATANIVRNRIKTMVGRHWDYKTTERLVKRGVMTLKEWREVRMSSTITRVGIDDLDNLLGQLIGYTPEFITLTGQVFGERDADNG